MGLFDKKTCAICGGKIGLFGNRKLSDGNLCKDCAAKLSPWFSERRQSTVDEIQGQLEYREQNQEAVAAFHTTRTLGVTTKVLLDEDNRKFMVTSASNLASANPDVLDYGQITGCMVDIQENKIEMKVEDSQGNDVSYNPPQYKFDYDFYMVINVNHPYFNEIRFKLNNTDIEVEPVLTLANGPARPISRPGVTAAQPARPNTAQATKNATQAIRQAAQTAQPARPGVANKAAAKPGAANKPAAKPGVANKPVAKPGVANRPGAAQPARPAQPVRPSVQPVARPATERLRTEVISSIPADPFNDTDYVRFWQMGEDIKAALLGVQQEERELIEAENAPVEAVICPWCGATTIPDANYCCEYCGGALNG